jgi:predicted PurR-regulated permease PerM
MDSENVKEYPGKARPASDSVGSTQNPSGLWISGNTGRGSFVTLGLIARSLLIVLTAALIGWIVWRSRATLIPFMVGGVLALILIPLVSLLDRWMPRRLAIIVIYLGTLLIVGGGLYLAGPVLAGQVQAAVEAVPTMMEIEDWLSSFLTRIERFVPAAWRDSLNTVAQNAIATLQQNTVDYIRTIGSFLIGQTISFVQTLALLTGFFVLPFWLFFVLEGHSEFRESIDRMLHPKVRADFWAITSLFSRVVGAYVRGTLILGVIVAILIGVSMSVLNWLGFEVPNILLLALFSGLGEFVPFIGPVVSSIPAVLVLLSGSWQTGLLMLAIYLVVQQIEGNFLIPYVLGEAIRVHPAVMTVALFAAAGAFGFVGLLVAPPVTAFGRDLFLYLYSRFEGHSTERAYEIVRPSQTT